MYDQAAREVKKMMYENTFPKFLKNIGEKKEKGKELKGTVSGTEKGLKGSFV